MESLVVSGNTITLSHAPKNGINGVMNFGTVRYVDGSGIAYDAPIASITGTTATISVDTSGQWDTFSVQVQYMYVVGA